MFAVPTVPLVVLTAGAATDDLGNAVPGSDWEHPTRTPMRGVVMPSRSDEGRESGNREQVVTTYRLYFPGRAAVAASSRIEWSGMVLEVVGDPEFWPTPAGGIDHTELVAVVARG